jgi:hypothetical protein
MLHPNPETSMARTTYRGTCLLCGKKSTKAGIARHLKGCVAAHQPEEIKAKSGDLVHLRVEATHSPLYWLDIELSGERTLRHLDQFLRREWVECCGHLSSFSIPPYSYGDGYDDRSMAQTLKRVLPEPGVSFSYEYDFGSTTHLTLRVVDWRTGSVPKEPVRILARNEPPVWRCTVCGEPARWICSFCHDDPEPFYCEEHGAEHECGEDGLLPVVDSPRMGVCGYGF